VRLASNRTRNK